jgi:hypothetical protein
VLVSNVANEVRLQVSPSGGLLPITAPVFTDVLANISPVGGTSNSPNQYTVPASGLYLVEISYNLSTSATGFAPFTQISFNPVANEFIQAQMDSLSAPFITAANRIPYVTTSPASGLFTQTYTTTACVVWTAGKVVYLTSIVNNAGTCTWGNYSLNLEIYRLC